MSAARSTSIRALRQLSVHSHQVRQLHIIGPSTYSTRIFATEGSVEAVRPRDLKSPHIEGVKRGLPTVASKDETSMAGKATRTMATVHAPVRPQPVNTAAPQKSTREINTTRTLKTPKDTSTIDFAYLPAEPLPVPRDHVNPRVPLIPDNLTPDRTGVHAVPQPAYDEVMRAQVVTAAGEDTYVSAPSTLTDVSDSNSVGTDYGDLAERMEKTADAVTKGARQTQGTVRTLWNGMVDDVFGPRKALS